MAEEEKSSGSGFGKLVYGTLKGNGINTEGMSFEEAVKKFNELGGTDNWHAKIMKREADEKQAKKEATNNFNKQFDKRLEKMGWAETKDKATADKYASQDGYIVNEGTFIKGAYDIRKLPEGMSKEDIKGIHGLDQSTFIDRYENAMKYKTIEDAKAYYDRVAGDKGETSTEALGVAKAIEKMEAKKDQKPGDFESEWQRMSKAIDEDDIDTQNEALENIEKILPFKNEEEHEKWLDLVQSYTDFDKFEEETRKIMGNKQEKPGVNGKINAKAIADNIAKDPNSSEFEKNLYEGVKKDINKEPKKQNAVSFDFDLQSDGDWTEIELEDGTQLHGDVEIGANLDRNWDKSEQAIKQILSEKYGYNIPHKKVLTAEQVENSKIDFKRMEDGQIVEEEESAKQKVDKNTKDFMDKAKKGEIKPENSAPKEFKWNENTNSYEYRGLNVMKSPAMDGYYEIDYGGDEILTTDLNEAKNTIDGLMDREESLGSAERLEADDIKKKEEAKGKEQEKKEYKITDSDKDVIGDAIYYASKDGLENLTVDNIIKQVNKDFDGYIGTSEKEQAFRDYLSAKGYKDKNFTAKFDEYGIPDNETIREKNKFLSENKIWDTSKLTNKEFNELAEKTMQRFNIKDKELAKDLLVAELE